MLLLELARVVELGDEHAPGLDPGDAALVIHLMSLLRSSLSSIDFESPTPPRPMWPT
jgi:hypothetical protein